MGIFNYNTGLVALGVPVTQKFAGVGGGWVVEPSVGDVIVMKDLPGQINILL